MPQRQRSGSLPGPAGHQGGQRAGIVSLPGVIRDPVGPGESALNATMNDHQSFAGAVIEPLGLHEPAALRRTISRLKVKML